MASQTINLGSNPFSLGDTRQWSGALLIDPSLLEEGGVAYLRFFIWAVFQSPLQHNAQLWTHTDSTGDATPAGPHLTPAWEISAVAITLEEDGGASVTIKGPNHPDNLVQDPDEFYNWDPNAADSAVIIAWFAGLGSGDVTLTLDDGVLQLDAEAPTVAIDPIGTVDEGDTQTLTATLTDGNYDALAYLWEVVSGGGTISNATSAVGTYNAPAVLSDTVVQVRLTVTATGTGTNATDGASDDGNDTENFTVSNLPTSWRLFIADTTLDELFELNPVALSLATTLLRDLPSGLFSLV